MDKAISVIVPCYRSAALAQRSVGCLVRHLEGMYPHNWEVVVVDDGGNDFPSGIWQDNEDIRLISLRRNKGKGAAIAAGMGAARGSARIFTDVDLPYGTDVIDVMAAYLLEDRCHLVIGDRELPSSIYHARTSGQRRWVSRVSATLIGRFVTGGFFDTQCGIKGVRGDLADLLFPMLQIERFAFDVELIYVALLHRLDIRRIPVRLQSNDTSSVRVLRDSARAAIDILRIKRNQMLGLYTSDALGAYSEEQYRRVCNRLGQLTHQYPMDLTRI